MEKLSLYKFTYISLLKTWCPIETKKVTNNQKKSNYPNLLKNKNHVQKKKTCLKKKMGMRTKKPLNKGTKAQEKKKFIKIGIKNLKKKINK